MQVSALPAACTYLTACGGDTLAASFVVLGSTIAIDIIAIIINFCYIFYYLLLRITLVTAIIIIIIVVIFCLLRAGEILRFSFSMPYNSSVNAPSRWVLEGTNDRPGHCRILQRWCFCHGSCALLARRVRRCILAGAPDYQAMGDGTYAQRPSACLFAVRLSSVQHFMQEW